MNLIIFFIQNAVRICRALFEIELRNSNAIMAGRILSIAKMLELQQWDHMSPLRQFFCLPIEAIERIEMRNLSVENLKEMDVKEIGKYCSIDRILKKQLKNRKFKNNNHFLFFFRKYVAKS